MVIGRRVTKMAKFGDKPTPTREERAAFHGLDFYELVCWRLIVRFGFSREVAIETVRRAHGITVNWEELVRKARTYADKLHADSIT
jgi:hypothetical protein